MVIYRQDGTPYHVTGSIQQFDDRQPEHDLFHLWDEESLKMGGSPIEYYECMIQFNSLDELYLEDRGKIFSTHSVVLWANYEPIPSQNAQTAFGIDSPDEMVFEINFRAAMRDIGHLPKVGSKIYTPHLQENWVMIQRNLGEFKMWGVVRIEMLCQRWQDDRKEKQGMKGKPSQIDYKILR